MLNRFYASIALAACLAARGLCQPAIAGFDFGDEPGKLYVSLNGVATLLGLDKGSKGDDLTLNGKPVEDTRELFDGTELVSIDSLERFGVKVSWDNATQTADLQLGDKSVTVHRGAKRAEVNKARQELRAYQGDVLVLDTHVSTGRRGHGTPSGSFSAYHKERMHYSRLYNDAPMPWAVEIDGNVFIHGYPSVPKHPASHGCIRMPLRGKNAARWFWHWVSLGTPVVVDNSWSVDVPASPTPTPTPTPTATAKR